VISGEQAGEARCHTGADGHGEAVAGYGCGVNPGSDGPCGEIVYQEARLEIIGAIENYVLAREQLLGIARVHIRYDAFHGNAGVDGPKLAFGGYRFGENIAGVCFVEERLALEVRRLDEITVDDADAADAGAYHQIRYCRAYGAASHDHCAGGEQALLAWLADAGEQDLPRIFLV